jgi:Meckel syndrome type 1 protein
VAPHLQVIANAQAAAAQVAPNAQAARPNAKATPATPPKDAAAPTNPIDAVSSLAKALDNTEAAAELKLVMEASSAERDLRFVGLEAAPKAAIAKVATEARPEALTMAPLALAPGDSMMPRTEVVFSSAGARELPAPMPARQLAPVVVSLALGRGEEALTVTLDPVELGRVEVSIGQGKEAGQVRIVAERAETLALLQRDQRELDRALNQAGLGDMARSLSFSLASDQGRQQHQQGAAHQGSPQFSGILGGPEADRLIAPAPYPARSATSLLDIAV